MPVPATPPSASYKLRKFARRNRGLVAAGMAGAASLTLGIIGTTLGLVWAIHERGPARRERQAAQLAAARATLEAERADHEAVQARAINDFMREVLSSPDPDERAPDVRLIDVLARASESAALEFAALPLQEAQVRDLLGRVYAKLSMTREAQAQFARSSELWAEHVGANDPRTLAAEMAYIGACIDLQSIGVVEQMIPPLLEKMERVFGPDHPETPIASRAARS